MDLTDDQVSFRWKDYRHPQRPKTMTVSAEEFIRRFLLHALSPGFQRIRYYGFLANSHRREKLDFCRRLLAAPCSDLLPPPIGYREFYARLTGRDLRRCPQCGIGTMITLEILLPGRDPTPLRLDSSGSSYTNLRHGSYAALPAAYTLGLSSGGPQLLPPRALLDWIRISGPNPAHNLPPPGRFHRHDRPIPTYHFPLPRRQRLSASKHSPATLINTQSAAASKPNRLSGRPKPAV